MAVKYEGAGVTITRSGLTSKVKKIEFGGKKRGSIEVSDLTSTVKQFIAETQWKYEPLKVTVEYDQAQYNAQSNDNLQTTLTIGSVGSIVVWAQLIEVSAVSFEVGQQPTYDLTFEITNRNGSNIETVPVFN